jgi:hypothetical protein
MRKRTFLQEHCAAHKHPQGPPEDRYDPATGEWMYWTSKCECGETSRLSNTRFSRPPASQSINERIIRPERLNEAIAVLSYGGRIPDEWFTDA